MNRRFHCAIAIVFAIALTTSACSGSTEEPGSANSPAIDVSKLDAGNYPVTPLDIEATRTDDSGPVREAIKVGNATPLVMDVDNRFIFARQKFFTRVIIPSSPPSFTGAPIPSGEFDNFFPGLIAGWESYGQRRMESEVGREVLTRSLRFAAPEQASAAAQTLAERTSGQPLPLAGYPDAHVRYESQVSLGEPWLAAWLARGDMLLHIVVEDPISMPFDPAPLADLAKKMLDKQIDMLKSYAPTPVSEIRSLPMDLDGLLSRTLPSTKETRPVRGPDPSGIYPKQAFLHTGNHPNVTKEALDDAGVDYVSVADSRVYRAQDGSSARRLLAALTDEYRNEKNYTKADEPANLPISQCFTAKPGISWASDYPPVCFFVVDRFVAQVGAYNLQVLHQKTAAQYRLLTSGR